MKQSFKDITIAIPESRQLNVLASLFEKRGAEVTRCPLVAIRDNPDTEAVLQWLNDFIAHTPDYLIILTGEGIRRLSGFAERAGILPQWQQALSQTYKLARGPKPNRALKELDLQAEQMGAEPTTEGIITTLDTMALEGKRVAVQLYGQVPNRRLQDYLLSRGIDYHTIAPYIYASDVETDKVVQLIQRLAEQSIDLICFTSKAQYERMLKVAKQQSMEAQLHEGLKQIKIAAVGPVVAEQLTQAGYTIDVMPGEKFFMKPMVRSIEDWLQGRR